ncbi:MAG TPA: Do family serine endopeptidase [Methylomirabilota bacterium]|jgi:serine protease Do|nr:Do family serine endopeptidase [Methylomirabilota bacterium]
MRRPAGILLLLALVAGALWATGVITVRVNTPRTESVSASPFWQEKDGEAPLPAWFAIWVELARSARPAVVNVSTTQKAQARGPLSDEFFRRFFPQGPRDQEPRGRQSLGSGVVVSADGYIVTNFHVVREADQIVVHLADQSEHRAKLVGSDPKIDIALLKIEASGLPALPLGNSDRLQVGEPVMAIGNPFGLDQTVTTGIVSAKERFIGSGPYDDFIQTDASVNPGNSGGALIDTRGALVGINTAIFSQTGGSIGIGFAIPVNLVKDVLVQLKERGTVTRGYLGVAVAPVTLDARKSTGLDAARGALVAEVVPRSPAAAAGIKPGDVITAFQQEPVNNPHDLTRRVAGTPPGTKVNLKVVRPDGLRTVTATLDRLKDEPQTADR